MIAKPVLFGFVLVSAAVAHESPSLGALLEQATVPGVAIAEVKEGRLRTLEFAGMRDPEGRPVDENTVFEAASLSKPVVAWLTLKLVEQGRFHLDEPLWEHVQPERLAHDERARSITARIVLSHTTGLPNWGGTPLEFNADPGERWGYSGEGFVLLQRALEARLDQSLDALARTEVFEPLGMSRSGFVWRAEFDRNHAVGHDLVGFARPKNQPSEANAAASLHTTAGDYGRFLAAVLNGADLEPESVRAMRSPASQVQGWGEQEFAAKLRWGLGWGLQPNGEAWSVFHWGDNGVFRCFVVGDPETGDGLVYFTNSQNGLGIAGPLVGRSLDLPLPSLAWLDYARYDDPVQQAGIRARQRFVEDGVGAGLELLDAFEAEHDRAIPEDEIISMARYLRGRDLEDRALELLQARRGESPGADYLRALAEAQVSARHYQDARTTYRALIEAHESQSEEITTRIAWLTRGLEAEASGQQPDQASLRAIAGRYGPRRIEYEDGRLFYSREDATSRTALTPLDENLFALESNAAVRLEVRRDAAGNPVALIGRYADGRSDETPRDAGLE